MFDGRDLPIDIAVAVAGCAVSAAILHTYFARVVRGRADGSLAEIPQSSRLNPDRCAVALGLTFLIGLFLRGLVGSMILARFGDGSGSGGIELSLGVSLGTNAAIAIAAMIVATRFARPARFGIGFDPSRPAMQALFAVLGLIAIFPAFMGLAALNESLLARLDVAGRQESVELLLSQRERLRDPLLLLGFGVVGPFLEEALFRGMLLRGLLQVFPKFSAVIVSALVFAFVHDPPVMLTVFPLGLVFGLLFLRFDSILAPSIAHIVFNLAQLLYVIPNHG